MKTKLTAMVCAALMISSATPCFASSEDDGPLTTIADLTVVRPACLVATVVGSAFFVISLPVAAASKSVKKTARTLVVQPARATFTRPLGDMEALQDW
jgi:hypothetical protein